MVLVVADDLGFGDLGSYGQERIRTPRLDALAARGIRFTDFYAGSTVCAPSRASLLTGLHTGHVRIRGNARIPLAPEDATLAGVLRAAGYATAAFGKWGLGEEGTPGAPEAKGFERFFGYLNQRHAHNYWPDHLWSDGERVALPNRVIPMGEGSGVAWWRRVYAPERILEEALAWLEAPRERPFFLYFAPTLPHANNEALAWGMEIPDEAPYADAPWPTAQRRHAAMITLLDAQVGRLVDALEARGAAADTLVIFTSDNGPHAEGGADPEFFDSNGPLSGIKRDLREGGIRVPLIVRWPGHAEPGRVSQAPAAVWDLLPTLAEAAGAETPAGLDGVSQLPVWEGRGRPARPGVLYWEFHPARGATPQAAREGRWKGLRAGPGAPLALYDLERDPGETRDVAADHPRLVERLEALMAREHRDAPAWPLRD